MITDLKAPRGLRIEGTDLRIGQWVRVIATGQTGVVVRRCPMSSVKLSSSRGPDVAVRLDGSGELCGFKPDELSGQMELPFNVKG